MEQAFPRPQGGNRLRPRASTRCAALESQGNCRCGCQNRRNHLPSMARRRQIAERRGDISDRRQSQACGQA